MIIWASVFLIISFFMQLQGIRVGDGSEYYAYYFAWYTGNSPWMTNSAFEAYGAFVNSQQVLSLAPSEPMKEVWPQLIPFSGQWDFNHFSAYSLIPAVMGKILGIAGIAANPHMMFLIFHGILIALMLQIVYRNQGTIGLASIILIGLSSPIIWFVNHVHTELFTFTVTTAAISYALKNRWLNSAILFSIASLQNVSFLAIAVFSIAIYIVKLISQKQKLSGRDTVSILVAAAIGAIHPTYYLFRYGAITSTSVGGGQVPFLHIWDAYIWLFDPDVGLLPNWPAGSVAVLILLVLIGLTKKLRQKIKTNSTLVWFYSFYVALNLIAQSSTTNLNSGATPGVARYGLWFLCLFLPLFITLISYLKDNFKNSSSKLGLLSLSVLTVSNLMVNSPIRYESYTSPTVLSYLIQKHVPWAYSPPPEIFVERYSSYGEGAATSDANSTLGPDCHKVVFFDNYLGASAISNPFQCTIGPKEIEQIKAFELDAAQSNSKYFTLRD